jgi:hypothetical protein
VAVRKGHYLKLICDVGQVDRRVLKEAAEGARAAIGDGGTPSASVQTHALRRRQREVDSSLE